MLLDGTHDTPTYPTKNLGLRHRFSTRREENAQTMLPRLQIVGSARPATPFL